MGKMLTPSFVQRVARAGRYGDGGRGSLGLSLLCKRMKSGRWSKSWSQRIRVDGRVVQKGLGAYPAVTLKEARRRAVANAQAVQEGRNPFESQIPTFAQAFERVVLLHRETWRGNGRTEKVWRSSMGEYVLPQLGSARMDQITTALVLDCLRPIWSERRQTALKLKARISAVCRWGVAKGYLKADPAGEVLRDALPGKNGKSSHRKALPHRELPGALAKVAVCNEWLGAKLAIRFLALTATRSGEVRKATWDQIDLAGKVWTVPGENTKTGQEHRVPLSPASLAVLKEARVLRGSAGNWVFPSSHGKSMQDHVISKVFRDLGIGCVPHGLRSSFRDWCGETGADRTASEMALGHKVGNAVEQAYLRTRLLEKRRELMDAWAAYLEKK